MHDAIILRLMGKSHWSQTGSEAVKAAFTPSQRRTCGDVARCQAAQLTTLSMSFQVFSTVLRSAAGCFGGPTASWMASMMPKIRPLLRFGPRPPGFRPFRAVAMSARREAGQGRSVPSLKTLLHFFFGQRRTTCRPALATNEA